MTGRMKRKLITHGGNGLFLLPVILLYGFVVVVPFFQGIPYSFTNWKSAVSTNYDYIGVRNYSVLLQNDYFGQAFLHTFYFTLVYMFAANILGYALALLLNESRWYTNLARTISFIPFTVSLTGGAIVWSYVYMDVVSPLFHVISPLGVSSQVIPAIAVIAIWRDTGYCMLIYLAALQSIPDEYYEAARVDGANAVQRFRMITFPLMIPAVVSNITLLTAWGLKCFDYPMAVARNVEAAQTVTMYVYDYIFGFNRAGMGQAAAIILTVVLIILTQGITVLGRRLEADR